MPCLHPRVKTHKTIIMKTAEPRTRGRPRQTDRNAAVEQAMLAFWQDGYDGTSMARLSGVMQMNPSSIYAEFGDKDGVFRAALHRYLQDTGEIALRRLDQPGPTRHALAAVLADAAAQVTAPDRPRGCLVALAAANCRDQATPVAAELATIRRATRAAIHARIAAGLQAGDLPETTDVDAVAGHVVSVLYGLSLLARDGAGRDDLTRIAAQALLALPG